MKGKRYKLSSSKFEFVDKLILPAYIDKRISAPHCIMELSMREYNRMKMNAIHVSGYNVSKVDNVREVTYNLITYGNNVKRMKKRSKMIGEQPVYSNKIKLAEMKGKYLFITGDKDDYIHDPILQQEVIIIMVMMENINHQVLLSCVSVY